MNRNYGLTASFIICVFVYLIAITISGAFIYFYNGNLNPFWKGLIADVIATCVVFTFSLIFKNASLYDPYWSVAPPLLALYWLERGTINYAQYAAVIVIVFWAVRLTLNWARGWQGLIHEDWRYIMLRNKKPSLYWLTNFGGIHMFPTIMVFLGMLPVYFSVNDVARKVNIVILLTGFFISIAATAIELIADEQLRNFKKHSKPGEFINEGLWKFSRHPNYFGEISFWLGLWVIQLSVAPRLLMTCIGFIAMFIMFRFASIPMMEEKNLKSKPGYNTYMSQVSMLIPWFGRGK